MMYVEQRVIIPEHLRCFCNEHELFTKGSSAIYITTKTETST